MDADVVKLEPVPSVPEFDLDGERCAKAAYELRLMLGRGCVDFGMILGILEGPGVRKVA